MSLGPAIATLAGWLVLRQALTLLECAAIVLVIAASIGAVRVTQQPHGARHRADRHRQVQGPLPVGVRGDALGGQLHGPGPVAAHQRVADVGARRRCAA